MDPRFGSKLEAPNIFQSSKLFRIQRWHHKTLQFLITALPGSSVYRSGGKKKKKSNLYLLGPDLLRKISHNRCSSPLTLKTAVYRDACRSTSRRESFSSSCCKNGIKHDSSSTLRLAFTLVTLQDQWKTVSERHKKHHSHHVCSTKYPSRVDKKQIARNV